MADNPITIITGGIDGEALLDVLAATLADIEAMVTDRSVYGVPIEDEQHPWHGIVKRLRDAQKIADTREFVVTEPIDPDARFVGNSADAEADFVPVKHASDKSDRDLIRKIAERACAIVRSIGGECSQIRIEMDLSATHANGCRLRLLDLLAADDFNLMHDISGIGDHLDRRTGKLTGLFVPRFAVREDGEGQQ